jgi:hypothetical protein
MVRSLPQNETIVKGNQVFNPENFPDFAFDTATKPNVVTPPVNAKGVETVKTSGSSPPVKWNPAVPHTERDIMIEFYRATQPAGWHSWRVTDGQVDGRTKWKVKWARSNESLVDDVLRWRDTNTTENVYHSNATFHDKTSAAGYNIDKVKTLLLDIDCGEGKPYADLKAVKAALDMFVAGKDATGNVVTDRLPTPWIVASSDRGLHVYFPLDEELDLKTAKRYADGLKARCKRLGFAADPAVLGDVARVLRPPFTMNRKPGKEPIAVAFGEGQITLGTYPLTAFASLLAEVVETHVDSGYGMGTAIWSPTLEVYYRSQLDALPMQERKEWIKIGFACHALGWGDKGFDMFRDYSLRHELEGDVDAWRAQWEYMHDDRDEAVTWGTVKYLALQAGWKEPENPAPEVKAANAALAAARGEKTLAELDGKFIKIKLFGSKCVVGSFELNDVGDRELCTINPREFIAARSHTPCSYPAGKNARGEEVIKMSSVGDVWFNHHNMPICESVTLDPGKPPGLMADGRFNLWRGFGVVPAAAPAEVMAPIHRHVLEVLADGDPARALIINRFFAWCVQHPGERAERVLVSQGEKGSGKTVFGDAVGKMFGAHTRMLRNADRLTSNFNGKMQNCLMVVADDVCYSHNNEAEHILRGIITGSDIEIEKKGLDSFTTRNRASVYMLCNHGYVLPVTSGERRYTLFKTSDKYAYCNTTLEERDTYFTPLFNAVASGGVEGLLYEWQHLDLKAWHPRQMPDGDLEEQKAWSADWFEQGWEELISATCLPRYEGEHGGTAGPTHKLDRNEVTAKALLVHFQPFSKHANGMSVGIGLKKQGCALQHTKRGNTWWLPPLSELRKKWNMQHPTDQMPEDVEWTFDGETAAVGLDNWATPHTPVEGGGKVLSLSSGKRAIGPIV